MPIVLSILGPSYGICEEILTLACIFSPRQHVIQTALRVLEKLRGALGLEPIGATSNQKRLQETDPTVSMEVEA
jgi:hypothetical protein